MSYTNVPTFTIKLEKTKDAQKSDGTYPVILRVVFRRTQRRLRLGFSAHENQFSSGKLKNIHNVEKKNDLIEKSLSKALKIYHDNFNDHNFDYKLWLRLFKEEKIEEPGKMGILEYAMQIHDYKISIGKVKSAYDYKAIHSLVNRYTKGKEVYFDDLKGEQGKLWLKGLESYLLQKGG